jgi:hypothetical protein
MLLSPAFREVIVADRLILRPKGEPAVLVIMRAVAEFPQDAITVSSRLKADVIEPAV